MTSTSSNLRKKPMPLTYALLKRNILAPEVEVEHPPFLPEVPEVATMVLTNLTGNKFSKATSPPSKTDLALLRRFLTTRKSFSTLVMWKVNKRSWRSVSRSNIPFLIAIKGEKSQLKMSNCCVKERFLPYREKTKSCMEKLYDL